MNIVQHINKIKDENPRIISINAEKELDKMQHTFMKKSLNKLEIERLYLNITKATYDKPTANIIVNGEKTETISFKIRNEKRVSFYSAYFLKF
jgi:hypothetical protein